jgi:hypothetical protein
MNNLAKEELIKLYEALPEETLEKLGAFGKAKEAYEEKQKIERLKEERIKKAIALVKEAQELLNIYRFVLKVSPARGIQIVDENKDDIPMKAQKENHLFETINQFLEDLPNIEKKPCKSMTGYYSFSKNKNGIIGLAWLKYQTTADGFLRMYLRKDTEEIKYPNELTASLENYKRQGWGGYPFIKLRPYEVEKVKKVIQFAYENL